MKQHKVKKQDTAKAHERAIGSFLMTITITLLFSYTGWEIAQQETLFFALGSPSFGTHFFFFT